MTTTPQNERRPAALRLLRNYDSARLLDDLEALAGISWERQPGGYHAGGWRGVGLVTTGGRADWVGGSAVAVELPAKTAPLKVARYLESVIDELSPEVESARLLALLPGERIHTHRDSMMNLASGRIRLHIPIVTDPGVEFIVDGECYAPGAGELWYADFSRWHSVANVTDVTRVHLVVDVPVSPELLTLFPTSFLNAHGADEIYAVTRARKPSALPLPSEAERFDVPSAVQRIFGVFRYDVLSNSSNKNPATPLDVRHISFTRIDDAPLVCLNGTPFASLAVLSPTSFRIVGLPPCIIGRFVSGGVDIYFKQWLVARCERAGKGAHRDGPVAALTARPPGPDVSYDVAQPREQARGAAGAKIRA